MQVEFHPVDSTGKHYNLDDTLNPLIDQGNNLAKSNSVESFLSGRNCLTGVSIIKEKYCTSLALIGNCV